MATRKTEKIRPLLLAALVLAVLAGTVATATAAPLFGNRSRDSKDTRSRQEAVERSSESRTKTQARSSPSQESSRRPEIQNRSRTTETGTQAGRGTSSIFDRIRNGNASSPGRTQSYSSQSRDSFVNRERSGDVSSPGRTQSYSSQSRESFANRDRGRDNSVRPEVRTGRENRSSSTSSVRTTTGSTVRGRTETAVRSGSSSSVRSSSGKTDSSFFNRVQERPSVRIQRNPQHYATYRNYYSGFQYRPHVGWRAPQFHSGVYYYSWPHRIEPCYFGHYLFSFTTGRAYRSLYFHFGYFPYVHPSRVIVVSWPVVRYVEVPVQVRYRYDDDYYLSGPSIGSIDRTLADIREAWIRNELDIMGRYIARNQRIHVYIDGSYSYSIDGEDYAAMTRDTFDRMDTIDLDFYSVRRRGDDKYIAYGSHEYYDVDGVRRSVYVSYTLERIRGDWTITEVGSSEHRLGQ